jgi:hypothetical protein
MPKTGSTFLTNTLSELTGFEKYGLSFRFRNNEQELYLPHLIDTYSRGIDTQQHVRANESTLQLLESFNIRPVILVRNLFDIIVSLYDHLHKDSLEMPMFLVNDQFYSLGNAKKRYDFIIEMGLPWYFSFYVSWYYACQHSRIKALWVTYEEVMRDKVAALKSIIDFYGIEKTDDEIRLSIERSSRGNIRLNKGISGRGKSELTKEQQGKIIKYTKYYPGIDFSKIGI